jgi:uncharacterized protein with von Willebrand factor type A (vWA) domain
MNHFLLHNLFTEWNKNPGLQKLGTGDYLLLHQLIDKQAWPLQSFDEVVFVFQTLWLKHQDQQETFRQFFDKRRSAINEMINLLSIKTKLKEVIAPDDKLLTEKQIRDKELEADKKKAEAKADEPLKKDDDKASQIEKITETEEIPLPEGRITLFLGNGSNSGMNNLAAYAVPDSQPLLPPAKKYLLGTEYFPVQNRVLQQSWRSLYSNRESNSLYGIDVPKTINKICREGFFTRFEHETGRENIISLFIFIDHGGSMVACEEFGRELLNSASQSGVHSQGSEPYFFHNVPQSHSSQGYMLHNEQQTKAYTTHYLFNGLNRKNIVLLIYSDAGAIRGSKNKERLEATATFLQYVLGKVQLMQSGLILLPNIVGKVLVRKSLLPQDCPCSRLPATALQKPLTI